MIILTVFFWLIGGLLLIFLLTAASNLVFYGRLTPISTSPSSPLLSICIPARNEGAVIGRTISTLLDQSHFNFELLILDDQSTDQTAAVVAVYAQQDSRVQLLEGRPLPAGWLGKNWACQQLGQEADGELILFTDADVRWRPGSLTALLHTRQATAADLLSVWPTQITGSWSEWLVVPLMKFAVLNYLPLVGVHHSPWPIFAAANGQTLLFTRPIYQKIGGHTAVKDQIVEDVALAKAVKSAGGRLRLVDGGSMIAARMYTSWSQVRRGFGKNILAGHADSVPFLILSTVWHWAAFVVPWAMVIVYPGWVSLTLLLLALSLRLVTELASDRQPLIALARAVTMPLGVVLMTGVALQALAWHWGNGPVWKERVARS